MGNRSEYQKTSPKAKAARKRYYDKNKDKWKHYAKVYRSSDLGQAKMIYAGIKHRATTNNLEFDLTVDDIFPFPTTCPVLGIDILLHQGPNSPSSPSVDRFDPTRGYTKDNIVVVSQRANTLKNNGSLEEFKKIIDYLSNYTNAVLTRDIEI